MRAACTLGTKPVFGDGNQRGVQNAPLGDGGQRAGEQQPEVLGKVDPADQLARQITSPDEDRFFIGGADGRTVLVLATDPQNVRPLYQYFRYTKLPSVCETILDPSQV